MISRENIAESFTKYKRNMKQEEILNESLFKAKDQESWMDNLRVKSKNVRMLYIENEAMINLYLRPFLDRESRLTDELADEFLTQLLELCEEGYCDRLICIRMGQVLQKYYKQNDDWAKWMQASHMLGNFYSRYSESEDAMRSLECFDLEREQAEHYCEIEDWDIRRRILFAFYNYAVVMMNARSDFKYGQFKDYEYQNELIAQVDRALALYDAPDVRALDGDKYDLDGLKQELLYNVFGNWVCGCDEKDEMSPRMLQRAFEVLKGMYGAELKDNGNPLEMNPEIYCNYWKCRLYLNELTIEEYIDRMIQYCDYIPSNMEQEKEEDLTSSRYYMLNMYYMPNMASTAGLKEKPQLKERVRQYILPRFRQFAESLPKNRDSNFINNSLEQTMLNLVRSFGTEHMDTFYFLNVLINRDETLMIHYLVVKRLALAVLERILEKKPELLIGTMGAQNVVQVLEKNEEYKEFVTQASLLFDIGKMEYIDLLNIQSRRLEESEKKKIHLHSHRGYEILKILGYSDILCEVALGHHKSYDGKSGYPSDFDNTNVPARFFIDLLCICDSMDAATDNIGRLYRRAKTPEEFVQELSYGAGHLYNPDIVALIQEDTELFDDLAYICSAGRITMYYEAYHAFVENEKGEQHPLLQRNDGLEEQAELLEDIQEIGKEQAQVLSALAKSTMFIGRICLSENRIHVMHNAEGSVLQEPKDGSFHEFIENLGIGRIHPEDYPRLKRLNDYGAFSDALYASGGSFVMELRIKGEISWNWISLHFMLAEEKGGIPEVVILMIIDINQEKQQQMQIREAMEIAHRQAQEASNAKSEFLSNMSHDIRTPMNAIIGMLQIAKGHVTEPDKIADCISKMEQASTHLLQLINEVLDMSKIESGKMELDEKPVILKELLEETLGMMQTQTDKNSLTFSVDMDRLPDTTVYGDSVRIREIVLNLMSNAVKYTPHGGHVSFMAEQTRDAFNGYNTYRMIVRDSGIGMSEEFVRHIFEPFAREQTEAVNKLRGTGLGLSITKEFVEMMRGSITVTSTKGNGSAFEVILRFKPAKDIPRTKDKENVYTPETFQGYFKNKRVLLVEDNDMNREILEELIADTGVMIEEAVNGQQAVEQVSSHAQGYYDMVFMDVQMPVMNGYDASARIRAIEKERHSKVRLPIVALTADVFAEDSNKALKAGMDGHLGKPVILSQLLHVMAQYLGKD